MCLCSQVPFVAQSLSNVDLALKIASRGGLPGADPLFVQKFEKVCCRNGGPSVSSFAGLIAFPGSLPQIQSRSASVAF